MTTNDLVCRNSGDVVYLSQAMGNSHPNSGVMNPVLSAQYFRLSLLFITCTKCTKLMQRIEVMDFFRLSVFLFYETS
jgi:hypothetical protein